MDPAAHNNQSATDHVIIDITSSSNASSSFSLLDLWISVEAVLTVSKIVAAALVMSLFSRHEKPHAPLRLWVVVYTSGCLLNTPLLYWHFRLRNRIINFRRLKAFVECFNLALYCFFAVWFVLGNVWVFGGRRHSPSNEAPNLYRLCIVFLVLRCFGYAMALILCATIYCLVIIPRNRNRGATQDSINSLPTFKFTANQNRPGEDAAVCCICLAKYLNNEELRELPCSHFFHKGCVDKWLNINASCPLCKVEIRSTPPTQTSDR